MLLHGLDISNYQNHTDAASIARAHRASYVVVRLSLETRRNQRGIALEQLRSLVAGGYETAGYGWCYWGDDPVETVDGWLAVADEGGLDSRAFIWLDAEDEQGASPEVCIEWLARAVDRLETLGRRAGICTGRYFWRDYCADEVAFSRLALWLMHYDRRAVLESELMPFGGWTTLAGKQFSDKPLDYDVFDGSVVLPPAPVAEPPPDPCAGVIEQHQELRREVGFALARLKGALGEAS